MEDYRFKQAIDRLLYLMHNDFKYKVGLAIHIVSEDTGFTAKELSHYLYKNKILERDEEIEKFQRIESKKRNINYKRVYRG